MKRYLHLIALVCLPVTLYTQALRFQQQKPHAGQITCMVFSPDSKILATADDAGEVILWSMPGGTIIRNFTDRQVQVTGLAFTPDGKVLMAAGCEGYSNYGEVTAWDITSGVKQFTCVANGALFPVVKPDGKSFGVLGLDNEMEIKLVYYEFNFKSEKLTEFSVEGNYGLIFTAQYSADGSKLGVISGEGEEKSVVVMDIKNKKSISSILSKYASQLYVKNSGECVIGYVGENEYTIEKCKPGDESFSASTENLITSPDLLAYLDGEEKTYDVYLPVSKSIKKIKTPAVFNFLNFRKGAVSSNGKYMSTYLSYRAGFLASSPVFFTLMFWNVENGKMIWGTDMNFSPVNSIGVFNDSKLVMGKKGPMEVWDPGRCDVYTEFPGGTENAWRVYTDKKSFSSMVLQYGMSGFYTSLVNPGKGSVEEFTSDCKLSVSSDFSTGAYVGLGTEDITTIHFFDPITLREKGAYNPRTPFHAICMSPEGNLCAAVFRAGEDAMAINVIETFAKKSKTSFEVEIKEDGMFNRSNTGMEFSADGKILVVCSNSHTYIYDVRLNAVTKEFEFAARKDCYNPVAIHPQSKSIALCGRDGGLHLFTTGGKLINTLPGSYGRISGVTFLPEGKLLVAGYEDGSVRIFDPEKNTLVATFLGVGNGDYLLYTPDGYYTGLGKGLNLGGYYRGDEYISRQTLDARYNCPDTVMRRIGIAGSRLLKMYGTARAKRLQRLGDRTNSLTATNRPNVEIADKHLLPYVAESGKLTVKINANDTENELAALRIYQNGVLISEQKLTGKSKSIPYTFELLPENNKIEIVAQNAAGVESSYELFETYSAATQTNLPQLYVLAYGVSEFMEKERNLDFAGKDATEMIEALENSPAFSKVNKVLIKNKDATRANFEKQITFLQKAKSTDVVIIYFSTHGLLDEKMDYYLATHDMKFENPQEKGIPYYLIEETVNKLVCHNRMVIMDACHSGEVDKDEATLVAEKKDNQSNVTAKSGSFSVAPKMGLKNSFAYMHALFDDASRSTGTHIIGAASGYQVALESGEWNNGAFTYALKAGLTLKAADENGDGNVTVSELQKYLQKTVPQLTNGEQTPALRSVNRDNDFRLW